MNRLIPGILLASFSLIVAACGSGSTGDIPADPPLEGLLKQVNDPAELEQSIKSGFSAMLTQQEVADAQVGQAAAASGNFTGTYTQEARVDEFDTVRYDGSHLYVAPRRYYRCCFFAPEAPGSSTPPDRSIRILETDPANGSASLTSTIPLEEGVSVQGMYVADERMFALTGTSIYGNFGDMWADVAIWAPEQLGYRIYDLSDPASPQLEIEATIDGVFIESRRIGNTIYIVSRYAAWIEGLDYYVTSTEEQASNQSLLDSVTLDDLLPKITVNGVTSTLVTPESCYIDSSDTADGYPVLTSITAVPIDDPTAFTTTCYNQDAYGAYVSENAAVPGISNEHAVQYADTQVRPVQHLRSLSWICRYRGAGLAWRASGLSHERARRRFANSRNTVRLDQRRQVRSQAVYIAGINDQP
jgi:hypothetical protein